MKDTNKTIEFIREKVIMANNPECKTYEEALEEELKNSSKENPCLFVLTDNDNCIVDSDYIARYYHHNNNYKIIGLSINLERVFIALNNNITKYIYNGNAIISLHNSSLHNPLTGEISFNEFLDDKICNWQPNKTLENQSEKTINKIAEILGYVE